MLTMVSTAMAPTALAIIDNGYGYPRAYGYGHGYAAYAHPYAHNGYYYGKRSADAPPADAYYDPEHYGYGSR
eukprot:UN14864